MKECSTLTTEEAMGCRAATQATSCAAPVWGFTRYLWASTVRVWATWASGLSCSGAGRLSRCRLNMFTV